MTDIYNLFKFLEDKEGREIPFDAKATLKPDELTPQDYESELDKSEGVLYLSNIKTPLTLPDNLKVKSFLKLANSNIKTLPDNLEVEGNLYISNTKITSLPNTLKVGKIIDITDTNIPPEAIPVNLQKQIRWYYSDFETYKKYTQMESIKLPGAKQEIKGVENSITSKEKTISSIVDDNPDLENYLLTLPVENFKSFTTYHPNRGSVLDIHEILYVTIPGIPAPLKLTKRSKDYRQSYELQYKSKKLLANSFYQTTQARGLEKALQQLGIPAGEKEEKEEPSNVVRDKNGKVLRLSQIIDNVQEPVSMDMGKRKRGGLGVKGEYKEYAPAFSTSAQNNLQQIAKNKGIEWKDFVAYRHGGNGDANFVVRGVTKNGETYYYNRHGSGQGGTARLYNGEFKEVPQY